VGLTLEEIVAALAMLPIDRAPTRQDWRAACRTASVVGVSRSEPVPWPTPMMWQPHWAPDPSSSWRSDRSRRRNRAGCAPREGPKIGANRDKHPRHAPNRE
jgi:hypothetical protein